jgi:hypothetical protein
VGVTPLWCHVIVTVHTTYVALVHNQATLSNAMLTLCVLVVLQPSISPHPDRLTASELMSEQAFAAPSPHNIGECMP